MLKFSKNITILFYSSLFSLFINSCASSNKNSESKPEAQSQKTENKVEEIKSLKTIYFDYNKFSIKNDQISNAKAIETFLKNNKDISIEIQGNTDSRGSSEYNMALGMKRAQALKKYLVTQGVKNRINTVSFGKEKPAVNGDNEDSWAKNRRDDVVILKNTANK